MRGVYWRAQKVPSWALSIVAGLAGLGILGAERLPGSGRPVDYQIKTEAAQLAKRAFDQIGLARLRTNEPIDPRLDPTASGLIGIAESPISSNYGHLPAKRTSIDANFAAMIVQWLQRLDAKPGDAVAVGLTGSFPALNIAVYAALQTMGLEPLVIASASASEYGATVPSLTWIDMERELVKAGIFRFHSLAATLGGDQDRALGQPPAAKAILTEAMQRNGTVFLDPQSLEESVERRIDIIDAACGDCNLIAYINIGGGEASLGNKIDRERFSPGITRRPLPELATPSVARRLLDRGVPVIHIGHVIHLARRFDLPVEPISEVPIGVGSLFYDSSPRRIFALAAIIVVLFALYAVTKLDVVHRVSAAAQSKSEDSRAPKQMV